MMMPACGSTCSQQGRQIVEVNQRPVSLKTTLKTTTDHQIFTVTFDPSADAKILIPSLRVRIPEWTQSPTLHINGDKIPVTVEKGYAVIVREWQAGDCLEVKLPFTLVLHSGESLGSHILFPDLAAISYGPQVFCLNDAWNHTVRVHLAKVHITQTWLNPLLSVLLTDWKRGEALPRTRRKH